VGCGTWSKHDKSLDRGKVKERGAKLFTKPEITEEVSDFGKSVGKKNG